MWVTNIPILTAALSVLQSTDQGVWIPPPSPLQLLEEITRRKGNISRFLGEFDYFQTSDSHHIALS